MSLLAKVFAIVIATSIVLSIGADFGLIPGFAGWEDLNRNLVHFLRM